MSGSPSFIKHNLWGATNFGLRTEYVKYAWFDTLCRNNTAKSFSFYIDIIVSCAHWDPFRSICIHPFCPCTNLTAAYDLSIALTRNCSKLRKIHSGQGPISLTINPSEFKFFGQFVLLWFEFSRCHLMSLQFLHMTSMTRDPYMLSRHAQNLFWWPEN